MGSIFARGKHRSAVTEQDRAVLQLKQQRDKLNQYSRKIERQLERERSLAKQLLAGGKKEKALLLLKKKRCLEKLMDQTSKHLSTVEQLVHDIEFSQIQTDVINGLSVGNQALRKIHQIMSLEDVERILEETREGVAYQEEIDAAIADSLSPRDTQEAEHELQRILGSLGEQLPDVPTHDLSDVSENKERDRRAEKSRPVRTAVLSS
ncbi:hypothetical protein EG68_06147 [Paragonimus skrjabini miyazakii]|uniref:Charged multivesicular body protein 6 n=1 Tax=Paragonimus skrjabini miyazakii TaxID=59628 RepID=A0A8S9YPH1_9TREM|nr:hypothetical protein EG68_06147 [Paragonimus skrjabini miyazakii]